ncbi:hypothetical protein EVAR_43408_1 [Eumeta japonica]|uniref:Ig-like domain-containing protein n=1 Tax=Eumeta variegata TaxID=151549 RepID=A0A4C1WSR8_EUMVA|nr:hypothetical protein EVAR_43408_1 [Eumeta japonica]
MSPSPLTTDDGQLPEKPKVFDENDKEVVGTTGPYYEGHGLKLTCVVSGGKPMPKVRWWKEDKVLETLSPLDDKTQLSVLELRIPKLTRDYLDAVYTCTADNTALVPPLRNNVKIQLYFTFRTFVIYFLLESRQLLAVKIRLDDFAR